MKIGIPKESLAGETRVACTPATVAQLQKLGFDVVVENGAGLGANFNDATSARSISFAIGGGSAWCRRIRSS